MKFPMRYFMAAALLAAPLHAAAQTAPPAAQDQQARERGDRGPRQARGERGQARGQRGPGGSPVQRLIAQRERLALTDAQVQRLQAIDRDLQARNAPLQQQLAGLFPQRAQRAAGTRVQGERRARPDSAQRAERRAARPQLTEQQRQQMQQRRQQAQPLVQQMRQNGEAALTQARSVLTAQQQRQVQQMLERRGGERGERRQGERARGTRSR